jgi:hypothetical protein
LRQSFGVRLFNGEPTVTAIAFLVSLSTGIRIAADALNARISHWPNPILPQGEIWTWHFLAGLALFFCAAARMARSRPPARKACWSASSPG